MSKVTLCIRSWATFAVLEHHHELLTLEIYVVVLDDVRMVQGFEHFALIEDLVLRFLLQREDWSLLCDKELLWSFPRYNQED